MARPDDLRAAPAEGGLEVAVVESLGPFFDVGIRVQHRHAAPRPTILAPTIILSESVALSGNPFHATCFFYGAIYGLLDQAADSLGLLDGRVGC